MADGENPDTEQETERVPCVFNWEQSDDGVEVKSVDIILGQSAGVSNDIFEIYTEGTSVKEGSPLVIYPLERNKEVNQIAFQKELQLPKKTYQFLFVVEDIEGKTFRVSDNYCCTTLVSGRTVNYIELDVTDTTRGREKDDFEDIKETSHLLGKKKKYKRDKEAGSGCGCGPGRCSVL